MTTLDTGPPRFAIWKAERLLLFFWSAVFLPLFATIALQAQGNKYGFEPGDAYTGFFWLAVNASPILMLLATRLSKRSPAPCNPLVLACCSALSLVIGSYMHGMLFGEPYLAADITELMRESYYVLLPLVGLLVIAILNLGYPARWPTVPAGIKQFGKKRRRAAAAGEALAPKPSVAAAYFDPKLGIEWVHHRKGSNTCIVFVHGILSDTESAFTHKNGTNWPRLLAAEPGLNASILAYNYRTDILCENYDLTHVVDYLRDGFSLEGLWKTRKLLFVAHSMGGIVARKFIISNQANLIKARVKVGLLLIASPSLGSRDANDLAGLNRFVGNSQLDALKLADENSWLRDLDREFYDLKENGHLRVIGKELTENVAPPMKRRFMFSYFRRPIVENWSAAPFFKEPCMIPMSDHNSIAKPADRNDVQYRHLLLLLEKLQGSKRKPSDKS